MHHRFFLRHLLRVCLLGLLILGAVLCASCEQIPEVSELSLDPERTYPMTVTFLNIGKADCFLIESPSACVLIDTGKNGDADEILSILNEKGIRKIDKLFITHFDKDHVGGADRILRSLPVTTIYEPDYDSDSKQTAQYRAAIPAETEVIRLQENASWTLDGIRYEVDVANGSFAADAGKDNYDNNMSLVVRATCGSVSVLFTGDVEQERLYEMLYENMDPCVLLKVPHHGLEEKYVRQLFDRVKPQYAVITSSAKEPEDDSVVQNLQAGGCKVYLTRNGRVVFTTDGTSVSVNQIAGSNP